MGHASIDESCVVNHDDLTFGMTVSENYHDQFVVPSYQHKLQMKQRRKSISKFQELPCKKLSFAKYNSREAVICDSQIASVW